MSVLERQYGEVWIERKPVENGASRCCHVPMYVEVAYRQGHNKIEFVSGKLYCERCGKATFPAGEPSTNEPVSIEVVSSPPHDDSQGFYGWCEDEAERRFPEENKRRR